MSVALRIAVSVLPAIGLASLAQAQQVGNCEHGKAEARLDVNGVSAGIYNNGGLFFRETGPPYSHYEVPVGTSLNSMFGAFLWIGGIVDGEHRAAASQYGPWEFWPGPIDGQGNPPADCSAYDRIYKVSRRDLAHLDQTGEATSDIEDWPWQAGAPVEDGDGDPANYDLTAGDRPAIEGDQSLWWIMNDLGNQHAWSLSPPLGIQVSAMAFAASSLADELNFTTFYRYTITNKSGHQIDSMRVGMQVDVDIGNSGDDYVGSDSAQGVAYG